MIIARTPRVRAEAYRLPKRATWANLRAACPVILGIVACGPSVGTSMEGDGSSSDAGMADASASDTSVFEEPRPPDIGPDAVICGQPEESVATDEEIAALAGCEVYEGDVSLDDPDVTDLSPLTSLRIIRGGIGTPAFNPGLETLVGLENVQWVGTLSFSAEGQRLSDLSALQSLTGVEAYLHLSSLTNLTSLHGLEKVRSVGGKLRIQSVPGLTDLDGLAGLEWVGADLLIGSNEALESLDGLHSNRSAAMSGSPTTHG